MIIEPNGFLKPKNKPANFFSVKALESALKSAADAADRVRKLSLHLTGQMH